MRVWSRTTLPAVLSTLVLLLSVRAPATRAQADPPVGCGELRDQGLAVSLSDRDLNAGDETGFCLVARPEEDTFTAFLPNISSPDDFRAAKQRYAEAMDRGGYDTCRIGAWRPVNRQGAAPVVLRAADRLDSPYACPPRISARDPEAARWIEPVRGLLGPIAERTADDFRFSPRRPLTIDLYTDPVALNLAVRTARPELDQDRANQIGHESRSLIVLSPTRGMYIILNLTREPDTTTIKQRLAHEYTHFAQSASAGTLDAYPLWFLEGQAEYQMERLAGQDWDRRADAARRERTGSLPHLGALISATDWAGAEMSYGNGVYSRGYSAVAFIAERWGYAATVQLFAAGSDADPEQFGRLLQRLTGMDITAFDGALSSWLRDLAGRVSFANDSPYAVRLTLADGRAIELAACVSCSFHRTGDTCIADRRPASTMELVPGDYTFTRLVPADRIHFPDQPITVRVEPGATTTKCLDLITR